VGGGSVVSSGCWVRFNEKVYKIDLNKDTVFLFFLICPHKGRESGDSN
jgi:hypothetical protein